MSAARNRTRAAVARPKPPHDGITTFVVADGDPVVAAGIAAILGADPHLEGRGTATEGETALRLVREGSPDVAVVATTLQGLAGAEVIRRLRAEHGTLRIVAISNASVGKDGVGPSVDAELARTDTIEAVRHAVLRVAGHESPEHRRNGGRPNGTRPVRALPEHYRLTPRELDILNSLARGMSTQQIADALSLSRTTIRSHIRQVFTKLEVHSRVAAVVQAEALGLLSPRRS